MTFPTEAKAFHLEQMRVRNVKRIKFANQFKVIVCDVMKAYYSKVYARPTWADVAEAFVRPYLELCHKSKHTFLILVADLYKVRNLYRALVSTTRREEREKPSKRQRKSQAVDIGDEEPSRKRQKTSEDSSRKQTSEPGLSEEVEVKQELPSIEDHDDVPPMNLNECLYDSKWKAFILRKIGDELRKKRRSNITIVLRGLCEEPDDWTASGELYDKTISKGVVTVVPCEEDGKDRECFQTTLFDRISCVASAEADTATISIAGALSDHHATILAHLCANNTYPTNVIPNILVVTGDGDAHTISMMFCQRRNLKNIYLCVLEIDWETAIIYNCHEAATALGDPKTGYRSIYLYCAIIYFAGCDYVKKINNLSCSTLTSKINAFINSKNLPDLVFNHPSPLNRYRSFARPEYSIESLVHLITDQQMPVLSHLGWWAFILTAAELKIAACNCDPSKPGMCSKLFRSRADKEAGIESGSSTHITLHQLMATTAAIESTIQYFVADADPTIEYYPCQNIDRLSGYYRDGRGAVRFGIEPLSDQFSEGLISFLNADPETLSLL